MVAGIAWLLVAALVLLSFVLRQGNNAALLSTVSGPALLMEVLFWGLLLPLSPLAYATVGAIIILRHPHNRVSWFSVALALSVVVQDVAWQYAARVLELRTGDWPYSAVAALIAQGTSVLFPLFAAMLLAHFPDGRLPGRRWRYLAWIAIAGTLLLLLSVVLSPRLAVGLRSSTANPLGLPTDGTIAAFLWQLGNGLALAALAGFLVSIGARWRRAQGEERLQIKWLAFIGAVIVFAGGTALLYTTFFAETGPADEYPVMGYATVLLLGVGVAGLTLGVPAAIAVAILRYRLYDVDAVIRRTLIYFVLSVTLVVVYSGGVVLLQLLFSVLTGAENGAAIAISTAMIAILFNPFRRRIQQTIDRRFYRSKYDAGRTLARLAATARDEVNLDRLGAALLQAIGETMQPESVSLWLPREFAGQPPTPDDRA
jgi:hypothetical protein